MLGSLYSPGKKETNGDFLQRNAMNRARIWQKLIGSRVKRRSERQGDQLEDLHGSSAKDNEDLSKSNRKGYETNTSWKTIIYILGGRGWERKGWGGIN